MAIKHLTQKALEAAKPGSHVIRLRDGKVKGFHLVIHPNGTMVWALSYTSPETGKRRSETIGKAAIMPADKGLKLAEARTRAKDLRFQIDEGADPKEEKKRVQEIKQAEESIGTAEQLFALYRKDMQLDKKRSADQIWGTYKHDMRDVIGHMKANEVTKEHCDDIIAEVADRAPVQANRVRTYMHSAFNFGLHITGAHSRWRKKVKSGEVPDFKLLYNPVSATKRNGNVENPRKRNLSEEEVKRLWNSIGVDALSADLAIALKLILSTGQRVEEVLHATWDEFDADDKLWTIPAERRKSRRKNTIDHVVPLTTLQLDLLEQLRGITHHKQYLFPHKDCDDPEKDDKPRGCDSLGQAVHRYCRPGETSKREPFEPFIPKDLRRTWKTLAGKIRLSLEIRNRLQGHAFSDIGSKVYDQWEYMDEKRAAMEKWSRWLDSLVTGKKAKVVQLKGAGA